MRKYPSEEDRLIASFVRRAMRDLEDAIRVSAASKHSRAHAVRRDLENAVHILANLGTIANRFVEPDDPDVRPNPKRAAKKSDLP